MRKFNVAVNGVSYEVEVEEVGGSAPQTAKIEESVNVAAPVAAPKAVTPKAVPSAKAQVPSNGTKWTAPLPGMILNLKVADGSTVKKGDKVITLEAMKMENDLAAPCDGVIKFTVAKGTNVTTGEVLAVIS